MTTRLAQDTESQDRMWSFLTIKIVALTPSKVVKRLKAQNLRAISVNCFEFTNGLQGH
jgi:hypothetical protein